MASTRTRRRSSCRRIPVSVGKPRGVLHPRVQQVGPGSRAENAFRPQGANHHQRLIRHGGVAPLIYQYGDTVIEPRERQARETE